VDGGEGKDRVTAVLGAAELDGEAGEQGGKVGFRDGRNGVGEVELGATDRIGSAVVRRRVHTVVVALVVVVVVDSVVGGGRNNGLRQFDLESDIDGVSGLQGDDSLASVTDRKYATGVNELGFDGGKSIVPGLERCIVGLPERLDGGERRERVEARERSEVGDGRGGGKEGIVVRTEGFTAVLARSGTLGLKAVRLVLLGSFDDTS
jgi:hypothetical protein